MRTWVAAAALPVVLTACGASSGPVARVTPTPSASVSASPSPAASPPPGALTSAQLATALIGVTDLPKGFTRDKTTLGTSLAFSSTDGKCAAAFEGVNTLQRKGPLAPFAAARASFSNGRKGPFLRDSVSSYRSQPTAASFLAGVHAVFAQCPRFTVTNPQTHQVRAVRLTPLAIAHVGEEGVAVTVELAVQSGPTVHMLLAFVRTGQQIAYVAEIASGAVDRGLLERAVRTQVKKLAA